MSVSEKYNKTINLIEKMSRNPEYTAREIGVAAADLNGLQFRDMSTIFGYLLDTTMNAYIMSRKLTAAYDFLIKSKEKNINKAVAIAGYSDQPAFTKAFKRQFGVTPLEAFRIKDESKIAPPVVWEMLSGTNAPLNLTIGKDAQMEEKMVFGISESRYDKINKALELEAFYGFPRFCGEYAFDLSEKKDYPIEEAFKYVSSVQEFYDKTEDDDELWNDEERNFTLEDLHQIGDDDVQQEIFFERGFSVESIRMLIDKSKATRKELLECDEEILRLFPGFEGDRRMSFSKYLEAVAFFEQYADPVEYDYYFYDFITDVLYGWSFEEAIKTNLGSLLFEVDLDNGTFDDGPSYGVFSNNDISEEDEIMHQKGPFMDELIMEQERWDGKRIDDDLYYDPDNPEYNDEIDDDQW